MRHIAAEGRCWVIGAGCSLHTDDLPRDFPHREHLFTGDRWLNPGDSVVLAPGGEIVAGPMHEKHGLLFATIRPGDPPAARRTLDVAGHYGRGDVFHVTVDRSVHQPISFVDGVQRRSSMFPSTT
jgi:nitrilase